MNQHDPNSVRRLSRDDAAKLAIELTTEWVATLDTKGWTAAFSTRAEPCSVDPRPIGKTPSRWIVLVGWIRDDQTDNVFDGGSVAIADLATRTVEWSGDAE